MTIVSPNERRALKNVDDAVISELQEAQEEISAGSGISIDGVGFIDGATFDGIKDKDKAKKVAFVAVTAPRVQRIREKLGLKPKDLHVTLGFEGGDIFIQETGETDEKGKPKVREIPKQADASFQGITQMLPDMRFGPISGPEAAKKQDDSWVEKSSSFWKEKKAANPEMTKALDMMAEYGLTVGEAVCDSREMLGDGCTEQWFSPASVKIAFVN